MDIVGLIVTSVGTIAGVIAAFYAFKALKEARKIASRQEQQQQDLASLQELRQRRRETLQACENLREHLNRWHQELVKKIDLNLSPQQIYDNIRELDSLRTFQSEYQNLIGRIRAVHEPLCEPLFQGPQPFDEHIIDKKRGIELRYRFTHSNKLERFYVGRQNSQEAEKAYVEAVREELKILFFGMDARLETVMSALRKQIYEAS